MAKKRRSDGKGNVVPISAPERHKWKCPEKGCRTLGRPTGGTAYTKEDARNALRLHLAMAHGK